LSSQKYQIPIIPYFEVNMNGEPVPNIAVAYKNTPITEIRKAKKRMKLAERRKRVAEAMRENPTATQSEIAKLVGVDHATISRDIKVITEEYRLQTSEAFMVHLDRTLRELETMKGVCVNRLNRLKSEAHRGTRWMEEWTKLQQLEIKLLGLNAPEKFIVEKHDGFTKQEKDDAMKAALGLDDDIIDISVIDVKKITHSEDVS
jgi:predicted transcriptional regulator